MTEKTRAPQGGFRFRGFGPEAALAIVLFADGGILSGFCGQALIAAAARAPAFGAVIGNLAFASASVPAAAAGMALGWLYALALGPEAALWRPLARIAMAAHVPLLILAAIDIGLFHLAALDFLYLAGGLGVLATPLLWLVRRGVAALAEASPPSRAGRALGPWDAAAILALPASLTLSYLALVPLWALRDADTVADYASAAGVGAWSALVFMGIVVLPLARLVRGPRPALARACFLGAGLLHAGLALFFAAAGFGLSLGTYGLDISAALAPVFRVIAVILILAAPLAGAMLLAGLRRGPAPGNSPTDRERAEIRPAPGRRKAPRRR